ncbi:MAG: prokaryotic cytochrome b561 family protein [Rhodopila sp.]|jgi:cytochrome b561|nr:prokaryotic cytochrome b561 family protein [Rhodopila sp.]
MRLFQPMSQIVTRSAGTLPVPLPPIRYTRTAIVLHWLIAALIAVNVLLGLTADALPDVWIRPAIDLHKSFGLTVLGLALVRILWRLSHPAPPLPNGYRRVERVGAHVAHALLYGLILLLPISGWLHDSAFKDAAAHPLRLFWIIPWFRIAAIQGLPSAPKEALHSLLFALHVWSVYVLCVLVALHIVGALKHQFIDRHAELQRMALVVRSRRLIPGRWVKRPTKSKAGG